MGTLFALHVAAVDGQREKMPEKTHPDRIAKGNPASEQSGSCELLGIMLIRGERVGFGHRWDEARGDLEKRVKAVCSRAPGTGTQRDSCTGRSLFGHRPLAPRQKDPKRWLKTSKKNWGQEAKMEVKLPWSIWSQDLSVRFERDRTRQGPRLPALRRNYQFEGPDLRKVQQSIDELKKELGTHRSRFNFKVHEPRPRWQFWKR